jgi:hypothetical protein
MICIAQLKSGVNTGVNATYAAVALIDCSTRHDETVFPQPIQPNSSSYLDFNVVNKPLSRDDVK